MSENGAMTITLWQEMWKRFCEKRYETTATAYSVHYHARIQRRERRRLVLENNMQNAEAELELLRSKHGDVGHESDAQDSWAGDRNRLLHHNWNIIYGPTGSAWFMVICEGYAFLPLDLFPESGGRRYAVRAEGDTWKFVSEAPNIHRSAADYTKAFRTLKREAVELAPYRSAEAFATRLCNAIRGLEMLTTSVLNRV
ncbi:ORF50 [Ranid herpesvirus 1]|uniref:ORF50 n=1 Tax=Ranid herpesvirus 1 TaxID=85655 RepID=Q14VQ8_9VIRU|nr:ORF50 [Ranid herpesvirus 1]ABG25795.1 ORF50 [Ranid herpesvirus 1]